MSNSAPKASLPVIGIDPGFSGAIALFNGGTLSVFDIPVFTVKRAGKTRSNLDKEALLGIAAALVSLGPCRVAIENVGGITKQSASNSFNFGAVCGAIEMAFVAAGIRADTVQKVAPVAWKTHFRLIGKDKTASREMASTTFPRYQELFRRVKDDGRAEAALIAKFAYDRA